jgi:exonuclease III
MSFKMKGIFWNSNGLRDQVKPRFLFDSVKEYMLDFLAVLETTRLDFNANELSHFCANQNFVWDWTSPNGRSGGILVGLNQEKFEVLSITHGNFSLKFKLRNKEDNFEWCLIAVYGVAQDNNDKENFLSELVRMCDTSNISVMVVGDFNIIRSPSEKK